MAAIIRLAAMRGASIAEEARRIGVGAKAEVLDALDSSTFETGPDVTGQVEQRVARAARLREEAFVVAIGAREPFDEFTAHLVVRLPDHRPKRGTNAAALCAERLHRGDRRFEHAGERAFPSGMRRADHAGLRIGEEDRAAVRGGHADTQAGGAGPPRAG